MDLTICDPTDGKPWDFNSEETREKARTALRRQKPYLFIGSPMCTAFCTWQALNYAESSDKAALDRAYARASVHMEFVVSLYAEQTAAGPTSSTSTRLVHRPGASPQSRPCRISLE